MKCYDCWGEGVQTDAVGICHHCSAGTCGTHGTLVADPVLVHGPVARTVELPKKARALLCGVCRAALEQDRSSIESHDAS
jgi:hypothetical protein